MWAWLGESSFALAHEMSRWPCWLDLPPPHPTPPELPGALAESHEARFLGLSPPLINPLSKPHQLKWPLGGVIGPTPPWAPSPVSRSFTQHLCSKQSQLPGPLVDVRAKAADPTEGASDITGAASRLSSAVQ